MGSTGRSFTPEYKAQSEAFVIDGGPVLEPTGADAYPALGGRVCRRSRQRGSLRQLRSEASTCRIRAEVGDLSDIGPVQRCLRDRVLDPAGHAVEPPACRSRSHTPPPDMRRILSHPGNPIRTAIFLTPANDSPASPGPVRQEPVRAVLPLSTGRPIPAKREAQGHRRQLARAAYVPIHPGSDLPARLMTSIDLRATPQVPAIDLP
jgi:hypothetical protein